MITLSNKYNEAIGSPRRSIKSKVELFDGSTLVTTFTQNDAISNITIDRVGEDSKFFGFGVSHKLNLQLVDKPRAIEIPKASALKTSLGLLLDDESIEYVAYPKMYPTEITRDENTNTITVVAYDILEKAKAITKNDLEFAEEDGYTIRELVVAIATKLEIEAVIPEIAAFDIEYPTGGNFEGTETLYSILVAAAEATQTIFYINHEDKLIFKILDKYGYAIKEVAKKDYFTLESGDTPKLGSVCSTTELGDNVIATGEEPGKNEFHIDLLTQLASCEKVEESTETNSITLKGIPYPQNPYNNNLSIKMNTYRDYIRCHPSKVYTMSCKVMAETLGGSFYMIVWGSNNGTSWSGLNITKIDESGKIENAKANQEYTLFTTFKGCKYYAFGFYYSISLGLDVADKIVRFYNFQLEEGTQTDFEPYGTMKTITDGQTQYVKDNPFWDLRDDIAGLVEGAAANIGGIKSTQMNCKWRGDFALEPGDKIDYITKDDGVITSYLLNDTITYNGGVTQTTQWIYKAEEQQNANPSTLGEMLNHTSARVDKVNKRIDLVVADTNTTVDGINSEIAEMKLTSDEIAASVSRVEQEAMGSIETINSEIATIKLNADSISASVEKVEQTNAEAIEGLHGDIATLTNKVDTVITPEQVDLRISSALSNGTSKVTTETGFTFDKDGLTVSKSGSEMTTQITEDGMVVYRDNTPMLTANNEGVNAANLHATTYLIIGDTSRFEDYENNGEARTGCFWIGG